VPLHALNLLGTCSCCRVTLGRGTDAPHHAFAIFSLKYRLSSFVPAVPRSAGHSNLGPFPLPPLQLRTPGVWGSYLSAAQVRPPRLNHRHSSPHPPTRGKFTARRPPAGEFRPQTPPFCSRFQKSEAISRCLTPYVFLNLVFPRFFFSSGPILGLHRVSTFPLPYFTLQ